MSTAIIYPPEEYSTQEKERLVEFRKTCENLDLKEEQKTDAQLIRWLRARDLDVKKAHKMLEQHLQWRQDNQIDGLLEREWDKIPHELLMACQGGILGVDKQGYPIFLFTFAQQDIRHLLETYGEELLTKVNIMNMEKAMGICKKASQEQGREVTQLVQIMDMEGYSFRQFFNKRCRDFVIKTQTMMDNNYPELLRYVAAINAPKIFHVVFQAFKPFIPKRTLEKMDIYGTDREAWVKVIREKFPPELVPKHWGGDKEGNDEFCSQSDIWTMGPLPAGFFSALSSIKEDDDLTTTTIKAREVFKVPLEIKHPDSSIIYRFRCEDFDIGFQILDPEEKAVVDWQRVSASSPNPKNLQDVVVQAPKLGTYTVHFDNSYSVTRSKVIHYSFAVIDSSVPTNGEIHK